MYKIGILLLLMLSSCGLMKSISNEEYSISEEEMNAENDIDLRAYNNIRVP